MNRKFLEELLNVVEDETKRKEIVDTLMAKNGELIESHKTEVATLKNDLKVKDGVVNNLNEKIKELEEVDVEAIKQEQFNLGKAEGSKEVETFKKSIALDKALANSKAKDIKLLEKLLDSEKLTYEEKDGNYVVGGLDEQLKSIKTTHDYLFEQENKQQNGFNLGGDHQNKAPENEAQDLASALREKYGN